jgi:hypothetical protein
VPNAASPFALQYQYGDVTHKAAYARGAIELVALASEFQVEKFLPVKRGHISKQVMETFILGVLNRIFTDPPPLWAANMIAILSHKSN